VHPFLGVFGQSYSIANATTQVYSTTTFTTSATAYNNGTPVQLIASTPADASSIWIRWPATSSTGVRTSTVFDIMAGGAGSEFVIIGPVDIGYSQVGAISLPIFIPAGTRLSIRVRSARISTAFAFQHHIGYGPSRDGVGLPQRWVAYGITDDGSANAQGTIVAPGSAAWGSWTAITTSTTYAHDLWLPMLGGGTTTAANAIIARLQVAPASTTDAATMATNGTLWECGAASWTTAEVFGDSATGTGATSSFSYGQAAGPYALCYAPRAAGASLSARMYGSGAAAANQFAVSVLAAI
jgi:hypothetical protein